MQGKYDPIPINSDEDLKKIIEIILCFEPLKRPSAEQLINDPIVQKNIKFYGLSNLVTKTKDKIEKNLHEKDKEKYLNFPKYYMRNDLRCADLMT